MRPDSPARNPRLEAALLRAMRPHLDPVLRPFALMVRDDLIGYGAAINMLGDRLNLLAWAEVRRQERAARRGTRP